MKLFKVLKILSNSELKQFSYFLSSKLFNKRVDVQRLFEHWMIENKRSHLPQIYWTKVFPNQDFSVTQWNLLTSRLFKLLETFLALSEIKENESQKQFQLAKAYRRLQQEVLFKKAARQADRALEKQNLRDTNYLQEKHDLSYEKYDYIISINRKEKTNLQEVSDNLDVYFLSAKLKQACNAVSRQIINQENYDIGLLKEILLHIEAKPSYLKHPAIAIYYYCYRMIGANDDDNFFQLFRDAITSNAKHFSASEMRDIYTFAINYFIRKLNRGSSLFINETYELYLLSLKQGFILEDGVMLESTYSNIIWLAIKKKEYIWARKFIEDYQQHLKPEYRIPQFHFSLGKLFYEQNQYKESLQQLARVESKAAFLHLSARILQLKIYYELEEFDLLENLLESMRVYLQRSKGLAYRREHYSNIITFTRQLLQLPAMGKKEKEAFRIRVSSAEIFAEKDWFLAQI